MRFRKKMNQVTTLINKKTEQIRNLKINTRLMRDILMSLALVFPIILWLTRPEDTEGFKIWFNSMSSFHGQPNERWYILMHVAIIFTMWAYKERFNKNVFYWLALTDAIVLSFSMFDIYWAHTIPTVILMGLSLYTTIKLAKLESERKLRIILSIVASVFAVLSYVINDLHFFVGEWFIMATVCFNLRRADVRKNFK